MNKLSLPRTLGPRFPSLALSAFALLGVLSFSGCGGGGGSSAQPPAVIVIVPDKTITSVQVLGNEKCVVELNGTGCPSPVSLVTDGAIRVSAGSNTIDVPVGTSTVQVPVTGVGVKDLVVTSSDGRQVVIVNPAAARVESGCAPGTVWDGVICNKVVVTDKTKALVAWGRLAQLYLVTKDGYVPVTNETPWNVKDANGNDVSTVYDFGYRKVEPIDKFGIHHVIGRSAQLGGPQVWRALQVDPSTGKLTHSGTSPDAPNYVPANMADYVFSMSIDPATPDWSSKTSINDGILFAYRHVVENGVSIMFLSHGGGVPKVVGAPQTFESMGTVRWMISPQ